MIALARVILQHEKEVSKQRLQEGETLERKEVLSIMDKLWEAVSEVSLEMFGHEMHCKFVDTLIPRFLEAGVKDDLS